MQEEEYRKNLGVNYGDLLDFLNRAKPAFQAFDKVKHHGMPMLLQSSVKRMLLDLGAELGSVAFIENECRNFFSHKNFHVTMQEIDFDCETHS